MSEDQELVRGWYAITCVLKLSEKTCRRLARWGRENRLPVFDDHRGCVARVRDLERWIEDQRMPFGIKQRAGIGPKRHGARKGRISRRPST